MTTTLAIRHEPTADCDGLPVPSIFGPGTRCTGCGAQLCACELGYGHDCDE